MILFEIKCDKKKARTRTSQSWKSGSECNCICKIRAPRPTPGPATATARHDDDGGGGASCRPKQTRRKRRRRRRHRFCCQSGFARREFGPPRPRVVSASETEKKNIYCRKTSYPPNCVRVNYPFSRNLGELVPAWTAWTRANPRKVASGVPFDVGPCCVQGVRRASERLPSASRESVLDP